MLVINEKNIEMKNGVGYSYDQEVPYGYCFVWDRTVDTILRVPVISDYPYAIDLACRLNGNIYYRFEDTVTLKENENRYLILSDENTH
jgi:hypothetical protein